MMFVALEVSGPLLSPFRQSEGTFNQHVVGKNECRTFSPCPGVNGPWSSNPDRVARTLQAEVPMLAPLESSGYVVHIFIAGSHPVIHLTGQVADSAALCLFVQSQHAPISRSVNGSPS